MHRIDDDPFWRGDAGGGAEDLSQRRDVAVGQAVEHQDAEAPVVRDDDLVVGVVHGDALR